ncbi:MAG: hypothetical protein M1826_004188 [Phylliscum demangeonii]|nr:MAG: hypothetical protein M1826_004188 [Phylliscum demangeonii]
MRPPPHLGLLALYIITAAYAVPTASPSDARNDDAGSEGGQLSNPPGFSLSTPIAGVAAGVSAAAAAVAAAVLAAVGWRSRASSPSRRSGAPAVLLKDPYNPHDLVASRVPGRRPHLPYSAAPSSFKGDPSAWTVSQNVEQIVSQLRTYRGHGVSSIARWASCMRDEVSEQFHVGDYLKESYLWAKMHRVKASEDVCIQKVNAEVEAEAQAGQQSTYAAGIDSAALHNPFHLEMANTPRRLLRLPFEHRPADDDEMDRLRYISRQNQKEIVAQLKRYDGQPLLSWQLFAGCMRTETGTTFSLMAYLAEQLDPASTEKARHHEDECILAVNRRIEDSARAANKHAYVPVRTYPPLNPRQPPAQTPQQQQRNEFAITAAPIMGSAPHAGRSLATTQSHHGLLVRLLRAARRPSRLLRLPKEMMREAPRPGKVPPAWEVEGAHY